MLKPSIVEVHDCPKLSVCIYCLIFLQDYLQDGSKGHESLKDLNKKMLRKGVLEKIAAISSRTHDDARKAVELLSKMEFDLDVK